MADNQVRTEIILEADKKSAADTKRLLASISSDVKELGKANQLRALDQSFDKFDSTITDTGKRFKKLTENIRETKAAATDLAKTKIDAFNLIPEENFADPSGNGGKGGGIGSRLVKIGQQGRNLPSTQIPGLPIATDAISNLTRLTGTIIGLGEKTSAVTALTSALTPALGATGASIIGITIAAAPFIAAFAAVGLALKALSDQAANEAEKINGIVESQRSVGQDIAKGLTSEDANEKLRELQALRADEEARLAKLNQVYQENVESQGLLTGAVKIFSGAEGELASQIDKGKGLVTDYQTQIAALTKSMEDGALAANDRAVAEKKRLDEQKKIDEEAKRKAEQLAKDIEAAQDRITDSVRKNSEKQEDNARQAAQKIEDIETSAIDRRADLAQKNSDDLVKIALTARRAEADAVRRQERIEADAALANRQAEIDAFVNHQRELEDLQGDALKDQADALKERNFLQVTEISESTQDAIAETNKAAEREAQDRLLQQQREAEVRALNYQREAQDRYTALSRARQDQATAYQIQERDAQTAYLRQIRDAETFQLRQEETTRIAHERELAQLQAHLDAKLALEGGAQIAERALKTGVNAEQPLRSGSNTTHNNSSQTNINDNRSLRIDLAGGGARVLEDTIRRVTLDTMQQVRYRR